MRFTSSDNSMSTEKGSVNWLSLLSAKKRRSIDWFPDDLIVEIFLRLPQKSLLRFRPISKGILNSINSPLFKKRYDLIHNSVFDFAVMQMEADRLFSMDFHLPDNNLDSVMEKEVIVPDNRNPRFIGSCKGIVCLMVSAALKFPPPLESYILLNPFNRTYQKVKCRDIYPLKKWYSIGFGYDCATDDYKIVKLESFEHDTARYLDLDVYSMRRDSWKQVIREFSPAGCSPRGNGICVEGAIHWLFSNNKGVYTRIAAFDLETEALRSLLLPSQLMPIRLPWSLHDLGGRLCVIVKFFFGGTVVWVMQEYGVETSWTRLFNIVNDISFVLGYFPTWDNARLLCLGSDSRTLLWFNTKDGSKEDIQIHELPHRQANNQTSNETQSWVCVRSPLRLPNSLSQID